MAQKLRLLFQGRLSALALKAAIFAIFLVLAKVGSFGFVPTLFFLISATILYFSIKSDGPTYFTSFLGLIFSVLMLMSRMSETASPIFLFLISGLFFYILLGLKSIFFIYRARWYYFLQLSILYAVSIIFFLMDLSEFFFLKYMLIFAVLFALLSEFFRLINKSYENLSNYKITPRISAAVSSLLILEAFWGIGLLPMSFINAASLGILVIFIIIDLLSRYSNENLSYRTLLANVTIFIIAAILVFSVSTWSI